EHAAQSLPLRRRHGRRRHHRLVRDQLPRGEGAV
ncbi:MAG: hypothetical protein AVDCRST_MAG40-2536, partial [uncultured Gemmatimonadaceae bacterium]